MNYPNLYEAKAIRKGYVPDHDGIGTLSDVESCIVTMATDGTFELDTVYPASGKYVKQFGTESLIRVNLDRLSHAGKYRQFFRVTEKESAMNSRGESITVHAEHLSYDLKWLWCKPVQLQTKNIAACIEHIRTGGLGVIDPFVYLLKDNFPTPDGYKEFWHDDLFTKREGILEIAELFGVCLLPDNLEINIKSAGVETGIVLGKGKNLSELSVLKDLVQGINGVYVYYQDNDTPCTPPFLVAPFTGEDGVPHYTSFNYAGKHPEGEFDSPADTNIEQLIGEAYLRNNTRADPFVSCSAKIADTGQNLSLYDIVTVIHPGFEINEKMIVQKIKFDVLRNRFLEIEVGNFEKSLSGLIAGFLPKG